MSGRGLPTGTVTFLFSDIEGSTRLLQHVGAEAFAHLIESHHAIFREMAGDAVVSTEGDSFFCVFATAREAAEAAVAIQRRLAAEVWPGGASVAVRMGLHTGDGVRGGDNYVGLDVHRAARVAAAAHGGQVLVSEATRAQLRGHLPDGVTVKDLDIHPLKDLAHPEHIFQLVVDGLPSEFPPIRTLGGGPANLPEPLTGFVGRAAEVAQIIEVIGPSRLVTLLGVGGAGKTRLAIEAGRAIHAEGEYAVAFCSLVDLDDGRLIGSHVAGQLAVQERIGRPSVEMVAEFLHTRKYVLIVDNCEHLIDDAADFVESVLRLAPRLVVLATSREPLEIAGEKLVHVGPMDQVGDPATGTESDAVRLFATRVAEVAPDFDPAEWRAECAEICARLDAIPLAIELAAARAALLTPREILDRLDDRFSLLTRGGRNRPDRHATLQAAIDWSYDLLDADAAALLRALAVFRGGFSIEATRSVCFAGDVADTAVLDLLSELRSKSLITQHPGARGTRFGLLESIREYAAMQLRHDDADGDVIERHRAFFTALARTESMRLTTAEQLVALDALEDDHDNLRVAMQRSLDADDVETAADIAGSLTLFWFFHAHFSEAEQWAETLLAHLPDDPGKGWLRLLLGAVQYDTRTGHLDRATERVAEALRFATARGEERTEMWARSYLATIDLYRADVPAAKREVTVALDLAERIGDFIGLGYATFVDVAIEAWREGLHEDLGEDRALELLERLAPVVTAARGVGDRNILGHILQVEGQLRTATGRRLEAAAVFDETVRGFAELGNVACACHSFEAVAMHAALGEDFTPAARILGVASRLRTRVGITPAPIESQLADYTLALCRAELSEEGAIREMGHHGEMSLAEAAHFVRAVLA